MRIRFPWSAALALALISGCGGMAGSGRLAPAKTSGPEPADAVRVMTFNIRFGTAPDGVNAWPNRRALALRVIRDFGPAVLGVQEALRFQLDELRRALPVYGEVGVGRDDGAQAGEYAAILYDRNRLEVLDEGHFWLSDTPEVPGSMTWGNRYPRIVTWAHFRDRATNATFLTVNTHWDHESQAARENGARLMVERLLPGQDAAEPVLVVGDLNCTSDNPAFRLLAGLADTFAAVYPHQAAGSGTFHSFRGDRDGARIDFVLVRPLRGRDPRPPAGGTGKEWEVLQADIVHTSENGRYPSDHFPVTAIVRLSAGGLRGSSR